MLNRERAFSLAIERARRELLEVIVDFELAFDRLLGLGKELSSGGARLRAIVDVSADFEPDTEDQEVAAGAGSASARRMAAAFEKVARQRRLYARSSKDDVRRARLVDAVEGLSIHPNRLRAISDEINELLRDVNDAELALSREVKGRRRLKAMPSSALSWSRAVAPSLRRADRVAHLRRNLDVLRDVERQAHEPLAAFRTHAQALHEAHAKLEGAKNAMVRANLPLVKNIAGKLANRGIDMTDLLQEGAVGLMRAVDRFDHRRGFRFATYAHWWIRQGMTRAIADHSRTIRVPVHMNEHLTRMRKVRAHLTQKLGRDPTLEELAEASNIPLDKASQALEAQRPTQSLDAPIGDDGDTMLMDLVPDTESATPSTPTEETELKRALGQVLAELSPREQKILTLRFGIGAGEKETLEEVGASLGITRERTRQIEMKALRKLQQRGRELGLDALLA